MKKSLTKTNMLFLLICLINSVFAMTTDSMITSAVKKRIELDASMAGAKIVVSANRGNVFLKGVVESDSQATTATELAQSVSGVKKVSSKIQLK